MAVIACASVCAYARRQAERVIARKFKLALSKSPFSRRRALAAMHFPPACGGIRGSVCASRWARRALPGRARYRAQIQTGALRIAALAASCVSCNAFPPRVRGGWGGVCASRWARRALPGLARYRAQIQTGAPRVAARIQVRMCLHWIPHQNKLARRCAARNLLRVIARGFKIKLARRCAARKPACTI